MVNKLAYILGENDISCFEFGRINEMKGDKEARRVTYSLFLNEL